MLDDFFTYKESFSRDELHKALDGMERLRGSSAYDSRCHMLVFSSEDHEINRLTLRYLSTFAVSRGNIRSFILVSSDEKLGDMAKEYATAPYGLEYCDRETIEALGRILSVFTYSDVLSFNSLDITADNDAGELIARGLLSKEERLAIACLKLDHVPDDGEIECNTNKIRKSSNAGHSIDWRLYPPLNAAADRDPARESADQLIQAADLNKEERIFIFGAVKSGAEFCRELLSRGYDTAGIVAEVRTERNHKDTMFCRLFSEPEKALSLYNAIRGTQYDDVSKLEIVTMEDSLYILMKNDVGILLNNRLALIEHQSSVNPNMPLRGLLYFSRTIDGLLMREGRKAVTIQRIAIER